MARLSYTVDHVRASRARVAMKITQSAAADALGVNRVTLNKIENGHARVSLDLLERMVKLYGRSREHLLGEEEAVDPVEAASIQIASALEKISEGFEDLNEVLLQRVQNARQVMEVIQS